MAEDMEIDDSLYSRQRYMLGDSAMKRMARSNVFLSGLGGLGIEIAKNIALAGVKRLTVHDANVISLADLSSQFFVRESDISTNRAVASQGRLAELNPYVTVDTMTQVFDQSSKLDFLGDYQCVVLCGASEAVQVHVDNYCRSQDPPIKFISCDVRGVFSYVFCDFGDHFEVVDINGEEPVEVFIADITKANPGVVSINDSMHSTHELEDGAMVTFKEVVGMAELNGTTHKVKVINSKQFSISDTSSFTSYQHGGLASQIQTIATMQFTSLAHQLTKPTTSVIPDLGKMEAPAQDFVAFRSLHAFYAKHGCFPKVRDKIHAGELVTMAEQLLPQLDTSGLQAVISTDNLDRNLLYKLSYTARGTLAPLCACIGGMVAQETLKALTGKYTPLNQWLFLDATELLKGQDTLSADSFNARNDRYDDLRVCLGEELLQQLRQQQLFMVGCGAIGCELLKNFALLGVGVAGRLTITDHDLIEKSNLNRQFLFRSHHIQKPKAAVAAASLLEINPQVKVDAHTNKVGPATEQDIYNDDFFQQHSVAVNALDNLEARRYMDSRCVSNQCPLIDSGTMGPKGHVQVIVPHVTESYTSQQDPPDRDVPYCTLKSFPATIEHTIQWARDKFETLFAQKPQMFGKFWETHASPTGAVEKMKGGAMLDGVVKVAKMLQSRPHSWTDCVSLSRVKFEKYFNHRARTLVDTFPLDTKMKDGSLFWQSPRRPPNPVKFDNGNGTHLSFVVMFARLYASVCGIRVTEQDCSMDTIQAILSAVVVPEYKSSSKHIETDTSAKKPETAEVSAESMDVALATLERLSTVVAPGDLTMDCLSFEKDDDSNGHIDFITAASNLRAMMYGIEPVDRLKTKLIAGRIVPAIATTTAAVAGFQTIELIKVVMKQPIEGFRCLFMNLALPYITLAEPHPVKKIKLLPGVEYSLWDRWEIQGNPSCTLRQFIQQVQDTYKLQPSMVVYGVKMIYVPLLPGHKKRLGQTMVQLLKQPKNVNYVDLTLSFQHPSDPDQDSMAGPPVRYFLK
ncbi:ubiquitin-like modifier-activating enzyme 6 [Dysidea avara]|uniref:ubiquitin-like modifier-activating enzyme 6 n=1 Tax=Dysidea avara TaxID=196820 RepID=UPI0033195185